MLNFLQNILFEYFSNKEMSTIVQIGANDGRINDPIYEAIKKFQNKTRILLIEPQANVIEYLKENYATHPCAAICCAAIGPHRNLTLYRLKPALYESFTRKYLKDSPTYRVPTGFTSAIKQHVHNHIIGNLPADVKIEDAIEEMTVPCHQLIQIIRQLGWEAKGIDFLQIDSEGMDDFIIKSSNIELLKPTLINFEHRHLPANRLKSLFQYLNSLGYRTHAWNSDDTLAVLNGYKSHFFK